MVRARVWLTCAAMHDPVSPVLVQPAVIGWQAQRREVELTIERGFSGAELLKRMKGWVTIDVGQAAEVLSRHGRLKILDERELVWEGETEADFDAAAQAVDEAFGDQAGLERMN